MKAQGRRQKAEVWRGSLYILFSAFCLLLSAFCTGAKQKPVDEKVPVTVAKVEQKNVPLQVRVIGNVQTVSTVAVRALVGGELQRVWFNEGENVRRGQMLFTIDPRPYEAVLQQAQANLARDEANQKNAESEAARYAGLVKKDYVTKEDYERMTAGAEAAKATVAADKAAVENCRLQVTYCSIASPIDGRTGSLMVQAGNLVQANATNPLVIINQIAPVYVQFVIPEAQLARVREAGGRGVPIDVSPQGGGTIIATGKLTFIDNAVDPATGTIQLKGLFANQNRALWPGQYVTVAMTLQERPNAVVIPSQAVQTGQRGQYVYVVKPDTSVEMRPVKVAESVNQQAVIDSGVTPGETVVTDGQLRLTPKSHVDVKNAL